VTATAGNGKATLRWTASSDASSITVERKASTKGSLAQTVYRGDGRGFADSRLTNGVTYRYTVSASDRAGNVASSVAVVVPSAISEPAAGANVSSPPVLTWTGVPKASYSNVQVFRDGTKVLSLWPFTTKLRLPRAWSYGGGRRR
jgi:hypothetical protein